MLISDGYQFYTCITNILGISLALTVVLSPSSHSRQINEPHWANHHLATNLTLCFIV